MRTERLEELIQNCVLGQLTEDEAEELSQHLRQDEAIVSRRKLRRALKADAYLEEAAADMERGANFDDDFGSARVVPFLQRTWLTGAVAAALAIGIFGWFRNGDQSRALIDLGVASVLRIEGDGKVNGSAQLSLGGSLREGDRLTMKEGIVELAFRDSGVHAIATAPLSLTVQTADRVFLNRGDLKLHVPPHGIGFVVETRERKITDLGTSFVVSAEPQGSQVFVLDGLISLDGRGKARERFMTAGELAKFDREGDTQMPSKGHSGVPELEMGALLPTEGSLVGHLYSLPDNQLLPKQPSRFKVDVMGQRFAPLIQSGFKDSSCLKGMDRSAPFRFAGVAGTYNEFAPRLGVSPRVIDESGWLIWYQGKVKPPQSGRYRFWGYADNNLLVAMNGKTVFDGSRYDSDLREVMPVARENYPAWPCLNARAGFASGPWVEINDDPVQLDLLFGEVAGKLTSGILLVEREGAVYEKTYWGQPQWPLFLMELPEEAQRDELERLRSHMVDKLMGSFTVSESACWHVVD